MKRFLILLSIIAWSCGKPAPSTTEPQIEPEPIIEPEIPLDYPKGITVEYFKEDFSGGAYCSGYYAIVDFSVNEKLGFWVSYNSPKKTPTQIYAGHKKGKAAVVINGGYFAGSASVSLAMVSQYAWASNNRSINWPNDVNYKQTVYPVRSAIGRMEDGSFDISWIYHTNPLDINTIHSFPSPLGNNEKTKVFLTDAPDANTVGAKIWKPIDAIGGGPRLVKDGKNVAVDSYWAEVFDSGGTAGLSRQPRTAIGVTDDNRLILIVCDGRKMNGSSGYTLSELAKKMIALGAKDAMNLDGGGSSCIVGKDGQVLNRPSDTGSSESIIERKVVTAVVIYEND